MTIQNFSGVGVPVFNQKRSVKQLRYRELIPMCIIRFTDIGRDPSMVEIALRCRMLIELDISIRLEVVIVGLSDSFLEHLLEWKDQHNLHTLGDWSYALTTILAHGSDYCPNCGLKTFTDPVLHCISCGANPGTVFEMADDVF